MQQEQKKTLLYFFKQYFVFYGVVFLIGGGFFGGFYLGMYSEKQDKPATSYGAVKNRESAIPKYLSKDVDFRLFWDVWSRVRSDYIDKNTPDTKLFYGALEGIVGALDDPYSTFLTPESSEKFHESLSGSFQGIGAEIGIKKNQLLIITPLPETPAEKAGLRALDKILAIDKKNTSGMTLEEAVTRIRGKKGTTVVLTTYRDGDEKEKDISITRDTIEVKSVTWKIVDGTDLGYIKVSNFNEDTDSRFRDAVTFMLSKRVKGLILDLRNNPGGFLDTSIEMAGYWIDGQTVVIEKYDHEEKELKAHRSAKLQGMPTIVLVNEGSASASEIVSGALQDYGAATVVGKKTFGKGSVQDVKPLRDGSSIKLTIAKWLTPKRRSINEEGIKPDIEVEITEKDYESAKDPQLQKAKELLVTEVK
ncbi:S41 family peptidase [Candidatus Uhrbacteria bacterium]|nr:S41 family peptidase [Candidatus Uhrbacteria bacterium]